MISENNTEITFPESIFISYLAHSIPLAFQFKTNLAKQKSFAFHLNFFTLFVYMIGAFELFSMFHMCMINDFASLLVRCPKCTYMIRCVWDFPSRINRCVTIYARKIINVSLCTKTLISS